MTDGVFVDIQNVRCIKSANVRFDNLTLLTGTDSNVIYTFISTLADLHDGNTFKGAASISHSKLNNKFHFHNFLNMMDGISFTELYNSEVSWKTFFNKIKERDHNEYDTAVLFIPEAFLPAYSSTILTYEAVKYLGKKHVDTIVVTQAPHIIEFVAYYGDYLFHKYDINSNCCVAENGVIECGSLKDKGDRSAMLEKAFKMYNRSFLLLDYFKEKREKAFDSFKKFVENGFGKGD